MAATMKELLETVFTRWYIKKKSKAIPVTGREGP
jgi:hypothetical protein